MNKKLFAALIIILFLSSTPALFTDVTGHFTVGINTPVPRFRANDYDRHVSGPIAYVWPGSGFSFLTGAVSPGTAWTGTTIAPPGIPGYQTPYPGHNPPNAPLSWYQLEGTAYAPFGSILTSTDDQANVGDLIFGLNFTCNGIGNLGTPFFDPNGKPTGNSVCGGTQFPPATTSLPPVTVPAQILNFTKVYLYIPPEFDLSRLDDNNALIQSTFTNWANDIVLYKLSQWDPYAPNWWLVMITAPFSFNGPDHGFREWYYIRLNQVIAPKIAGRYFFKVFFEDAVDASIRWPGGPSLNFAPDNLDGSASTGTSTRTGGGRVPMGATAVTVPVQNWPVLLVKGEIDPAIVTGTLRYGTYNTTIYGRAIDLPGRVRLVGNAIDPYDPKRPVLARKVEARGYFNASARGHFEVEGVAPGVYDILASAAGYPEQLIASKVTILAGQSFHLDGYLQPGAVVHGQVFSKHNFGEEPWPATSYKCSVTFTFSFLKSILTATRDFDCQPPFDVASLVGLPTTLIAVLSINGVSSASGARPVYIELYNKNDYKDSSVVAYSPLNLTHSPWMSHDWPRLSSAPRPRRVAFDWESNANGPGGAIAYYQNTAVNAAGYPFTCGNLPTGVTGPTSTFFPAGAIIDPCGVNNGVGPAQFWWVDSGGAFTNGGGPNSFIYRFGVKGVYGAPTDIDGHIPQPLATWVNGLTPGRYWVRVWINGYVQTKADGVTLDEFFFDVAANEWAGDIFTPTDLRKSSKIVKTVHFHNLPGELIDQPICEQGTDAHAALNLDGSSGCTSATSTSSSPVFQDSGTRFLIAEARDPDGNLRGMNYTRVTQGKSSVDIQINGWGMIGCGPSGTPTSCPSQTVSGMKYSLLAIRGIRDYGLTAGTYKVYVYMRGYVQQEFESLTLTLSGSDARISNHMYRGARFNITLFSIDFERPRVQRPWAFPGAPGRVYFFPSTLTYSSTLWYNSFTQPLACYPKFQQVPFDPSIITDQGLCNSASARNDVTGTTLKLVHFDGYRSVELVGPADQDFAGTSAVLGHSTGPTLSIAPPVWYGGFLPTTGRYRFSAAPYRTIIGFETDTYSVYGYTYGYVQKKDFVLFAQKGQIADVKLNLMQGVNITLDVKFKRENVFVNTPFNMSMRVRVFNEQGILVAVLGTSFPGGLQQNGAYVTDLDTSFTTFTGRNFGWTDSRQFPGVSGTSQYYVDPDCGSVTFDRGAEACLGVFQGLNPYSGPGLVDPSVISDSFLWHWPGGFYPGVSGSSGPTSWPGTPGYYVFDSNTVNVNFQPPLFRMGFGWRIGDSTADVSTPSPFAYIPTGIDQLRVNIAGIYDYLDPLRLAGKLKLASPRINYLYGIDGYPNYQGEWTIELDFTPIYPAPSFNCDVGAGKPCANNWWPVEGLLTGDSFHVIPGAGFGKTGDSAAGNHLGPFTQRAVWRVPNAHLAAEASVIFEVDKLGFISGQVFGFTWSDELRTQSWTVLQAVSADGKQTFNYYTFDSYYSLYLPAGTWKFTVYTWSPARNQGFKTITNTVVISNGQITFGVNYYLERSNIPIPEFTATALLAFAALLSSLYVTKRKRAKPKQ